MDKKNNDISESFLNLLEIMASLRDPENGCEWDKSQDSFSIRKYCIEEAYEVVDTIENNDTQGLCEELGDLFFQVIFHAEINSEKGNFNINDVINNLSKKMIRRHPHVFNNDIKTKSLKQIEKNWIEISAELEVLHDREVKIWKHEPKTLNLWGPHSIMRS